MASLSAAAPKLLCPRCRLPDSAPADRIHPSACSRRCRSPKFPSSPSCSSPCACTARQVPCASSASSTAETQPLLRFLFIMTFNCGLTKITAAVRTSLLSLLLFSLTNLLLSVLQHEEGWTDCTKKAQYYRQPLPPTRTTSSGPHPSMGLTSVQLFLPYLSEHLLPCSFTYELLPALVHAATRSKSVLKKFRSLVP